MIEKVESFFSMCPVWVCLPVHVLWYKNSPYKNFRLKDTVKIRAKQERNRDWEIIDEKSVEHFQ